VLGTGSVARLLAADMRLVRDARLVAVGSRSAERARAFAAEFGVPRAHDAYEALIGDREVDVVYVATLNTLHREHAVASLAAGKGVLCEKPFTMDAGEAREVQLAAQRAGSFCMEAMWMRFAPAVRELQRLLEAGAIGKLESVATSLGFPVSPDPRHRIFDPEVGGGTLLDLGVYPVSLCSALLGAPEGVTARATIGGSGVDEEVTTELTYRNGVRASIATSVRERLANDATVTGSGGRLHLAAPLYFPRSLTLEPQDPAAQPGRGAWHEGLRGLMGMPRGARALELPPIAGSGYQYQVQEVMDCLASGRVESDIIPLAESVSVMQTMDEIRAAWNAPR